MLIQYCEEQKDFEITDFQGNIYKMKNEKTGACLIPANYTLGKSLEYCNI